MIVKAAPVVPHDEHDALRPQGALALRPQLAERPGLAAAEIERWLGVQSHLATVRNASGSHYRLAASSVAQPRTPSWEVTEEGIISPILGYQDQDVLDRQPRGSSRSSLVRLCRVRQARAVHPGAEPRPRAAPGSSRAEAVACHGGQRVD